MPSPTGWLTNWVQLTNTSTSGGAWLNPYVAKLHPSCLLSGAPSNFRVPVNVNTRDAGTLGDQGTLERGGTYVVPRELGVAIAGLGAGTLS